MISFFGRRLRRRVWIPLFAAITGGVVVLGFEWLVLRPSKVRVPVVVSSSANTMPVGNLAPEELAERILVNPCVDLHSYVCMLSRTEDPTGEVRRDSEGEVEALRIYEKIIRTNKRLSSDKVDELLVKEIYTPDRTARIQALFEKARTYLLRFIDSQPFSALTLNDKQILRERVERVRLELPPPASIYADEPGLFTRNDVFFERTTNGSVRIRIGGALLFTAKSQFNLAFTLAHELAHTIDPCELRSAGVDILAYEGLSACFGSPVEILPSECTPNGRLPEIFADWVATHVVADILADSVTHFTPNETRSAVFSTVRDLCTDSGLNDEPNEEEGGLSSAHPTVAFRVNRIFAQHPKIRKMLGCKSGSGPTLPGVPLYCFWTVPPAKKAKAAKERTHF